MLPQDWIVETEELAAPFTSCAFPPREDEDEEMRPHIGQGGEFGLWAMTAGDGAIPLFDAFPGAHDPLRSFPTPAYRSPRRKARARARAEEMALWAEAMGEDVRFEEEEPVVPEEDDEDDEEDGPLLEDDDPVVFAGPWVEDFYEDPPDEDDIVPAAAWLAASYGEFLWFFARHDPWRRAYGVDYSQRRLTIGGRPAATVVYRYLSGDDGETAAALRVVVVQFADDRVSYALGLAHSADGCRLVDAILASVEVL